MGRIPTKCMMQSKAWSVKILLTGSQISRFHTHKKQNLPSLPVGFLFIRGAMLLGGDGKYNYCQPIRRRVSDEVISPREFRKVQRGGGK